MQMGAYLKYVDYSGGGGLLLFFRYHNSITTVLELSWI